MMLIMIKQFMNEAKHTIQAEFELMKVEQTELQQICRALASMTGSTPSGQASPTAEGQESKGLFDSKGSTSAPLVASVSGAANLRNADFMGASDPYVSIQLKGLDGKPKGDAQVTTCKRNTLNPVWDETFEFMDYAAGDQLSFEVKDQDPAKNDDFLGIACLTADHLKDGFSGEFMLEGAGDTQGKATLSISVSPPLTRAKPEASVPAPKAEVRSSSKETSPQKASGSGDVQMKQVIATLGQLESAQRANGEALSALQSSCQEIKQISEKLQAMDKVQEEIKSEVVGQTLPDVPKAGKLLRENIVKDLLATEGVPPERKLDFRARSTEPSWACCRAQQPIIQSLPSKDAVNASDNV